MTDRIGPSRSVSVVIPTVRVDRWLREAVASALEQTWQCQVVVVLDGCSGLDERDFDGNVEVRSLPQVEGVAAARNHGLRTADGEFVAVLDSDDLADKDRLARQVTLLDASAGTALVAGALRVVTASGSTAPARGARRLAPSDVVDALLVRNPFAHSGTLMSRAALNTIGGYDERLPRFIDYDLYLRLALDDVAMMADPGAVGTYRIVHDGRLSARAVPRSVVRHITALRSQLAAKHGVGSARTQLRNSAWAAANSRWRPRF